MVSFINSFLSYIMLMLVILVVAGIGCFIGITARKNKNKKETAPTESNS